MSYIYKTGRAELYDQIRKHAHFIKGRVLDVGAGSYPRYKNLFQTTEYLSMDTEAREGVDAVGKIEQIPFPEQSFDSVVCTQVLGDVFELPQAMAQIFKVLKPSGIALITENLFDTLHDEPYDYWRFTEHSLRKLSEDAGFEIEVLEKRGGYHSVMSQLKARYWIEKLGANNRWYARPLSLLFKATGEYARYLDRHDKSRAGQVFTHGYILIARKPNLKK